MSDNSENNGELEKLDLTTPNFTDQNIMHIAELFPNVVTESRDEDGKVKHAIDFDALKQELSDNIVEGSQERYQLNWPGKRDAMQAANAPINKTLRPCREESVDFDTTKNLFIEGDNLDALKLLQETYLGKVKMIYIDPPYNTGKDFIYKDNFTVNKDEYLEESGQRNEDGGRLVANPESNGRYHSDWLSMMYPRLKLARNLLRDDGVIFISIDDGEVGNLRECCDNVFGGANFISNVVWQKKYTRSNDAKWFSDNHDHILVYAKVKESLVLNLLPRTEEQNSAYKNPDHHPKGSWKATPLHAKSGTNSSSFTFNNGISWNPPTGTFRRFNDKSMCEMEKNDEIWFGTDGSQTPARKSFLCDVKDGIVPVTIWSYNEVGHNHEANTEIKKLDLGGFFQNPKPTRLISNLITLGSSYDDNNIILDFFAGSATTAHAALRKQTETNPDLRFIMVQLPEECIEGSAAHISGFSNIAEISKERIRRAGKKILEENPDQVGKLDVGFRVLKIESSNMTDVWHSPEQVSQDDLLSQVSNIKPDRSGEDLLFQVLLDWGVDLTLPIARESIQGKEVFFVDDNALAACYDTGVSEELVKQIAQRQPLRVVFRDDGFDSDATKINVEQLFKHLSPHTEVKVI